MTTHNPKIAIIGAGGVVFPLRLMGDLLSFPALQDATYALMDLDLTRAEHTAAEARELANHNGFGAVIEATDDRRAALTDADYVIVTFMVGGTDVYRHNMEIPRTYGVDQRIGDTLGPGGVFRFLRTYTAYSEIAKDMHEVCPDALLINYANPMAMNCWYLSELGITTVGLCHSVQGTSRMLAENIDVAYDDITFRCAGINHQAWFLEFQRDGEDLRPAIQQAMTAKYVEKDIQDRGVWGGERVRTEIMNAFGYFHTESSPHASEYLPYFRKNDDLIEQYVPIRWDYDEVYARNLARQSDRTLVEKLLADPGIVRNRLKVESTVWNAKRILELDVPLSELLWSFVGGEPKVNRWKTTGEIPAETVESKAMSKELKRRGFRFVGPTVCYAFMQAVGLVDDHTADCFVSRRR